MIIIIIIAFFYVGYPLMAAAFDGVERFMKTFESDREIFYRFSCSTSNPADNHTTNSINNQ